LYELDNNTLEITRTVTISNVENTDWEDIAQDDMYIYIADIGNNNGNRTDLKILRIKKSDYDTSDTVTAALISYAYEDQTSFISDRNTDFDAEALLVYDTDLIVFTKEWVGMGTTAYRIPKLPGDYIAENIGSYPVDGLITGATYTSTNSNEIYLVGYSQFLSPFFIKFDNQEATSILTGEATKTTLNIGFAQVESIAFDDDTRQFFISSEEFINEPVLDTKARLFSFELDNNQEEDGGEDDENEEEDVIEEVDSNREEVLLIKPFGETIIRYNLNTTSRLLAVGVFDASGKLIRLNFDDDLEDTILPTETLNSGVYYATFYFEDKRISRAFQKN